MKKIITKSLSILGFTIPMFGCDAPEMYGTPWADYEVKGKVLDADGDPIKGIKVSLIEDQYNSQSTQSLENGTFKVSLGTIPFDKLKLTAQDIDGAENGGEFEEQTIELDFSKVEATGDKDAWYNGTKSIEKYIVMQEKSNEAQE
jgi:putative lipoprotein (rSAM/lipoprotein system)